MCRRHFHLQFNISSQNQVHQSTRIRKKNDTLRFQFTAKTIFQSWLVLRRLQTTKQLVFIYLTDRPNKKGVSRQDVFSLVKNKQKPIERWNITEKKTTKKMIRNTKVLIFKHVCHCCFFFSLFKAEHIATILRIWR